MGLEGRAPVLALRGVRRRFGGVTAVDGVTLDIQEGEVLALIGPNGAGKSTLFGLMMGELAVSGGEIRLEGRDMHGLSPSAHARSGIGRTFQTPRLFSGLTVRENILIALLAETRGGRSQVGIADGLSRVGTKERRSSANAEAALVEVGLDEQAPALAASLSQGQRKRLELAMVLALRPRILLLDEPTAGMGVAERASIMELVMGAVRRRGLTMVFCEHDMETVFAHAQRVVVMDRGTILADGTAERVRADRRVQRIYLGRQAHEEPS
jgi:branched-chain amino acid transport system ATP-binding protein